jgi:hypothetical protein
LSHPSLNKYKKNVEKKGMFGISINPSFDVLNEKNKELIM